MIRSQTRFLSLAVFCKGEYLPRFFSIYINDRLDVNYSSQRSAFADDLKIFGKPGPELQSDIDYVYEWSVKNRIPLNTDKCVVLHFEAKTSKIQLSHGIHRNEF